MMSAEAWIKHLNLESHPEGGFFQETYRSAAGSDGRHYSTAIYFLLRSQDISAFHRIKSDELWHFYAGSSLTLYILNEQGLSSHQLGSDFEKGQLPQVVIPAHQWFAAKVNEPNCYVLAGCTVAPGFDFADFELAERNELIKTFSAHQDIITLLTR